MARTASRPVRGAAGTTRAFLFADLRGYTDFVEAKGDAAAARLLRDYRTLVRREVARYAGAEVKTEGDSFYVVFDSASAALDCAVAVQRRAAARNEKDSGAALRIGMGLHAGETVAFDQQFVGSAVNVAARLASAAGAGEIVASDTLRGLVRTGTTHELRDRGELELKGVSERVRAWTVDWRDAVAERAAAPADVPPIPAAPALTTAPGQTVCPVVIGRDPERARALELLDAARAGRGQTMVVGGEAGVGKSALVRDVTALATERGFRVLYGPTLEADGGLPYAPFIAAVRSGFRGLERDRLGRVLAQAAPDLAELFPELGRPRAREAAPSDQHRLAIAFHGLFATFARETPVLLVVEDLHWADEASYALLLYLAREMRDARVLILATYRSDEMHRRHPFLRVQAALQRDRLATEVQLRRLTKDEVASLIRETFRLKNPVSPEFRDAIYDRSEGNPFFTEELLRSLVDSGDVYRTDTGWGRRTIEQLKIPGSIREAVRSRVERLSEEARATLAAAAVIGLQFPFAALQRTRGIAEVDLEAHLREFIEQQLVVELGGPDERYAFRHALTKEVVYDDLLVRERKRLHRAVADALEADAASEPAILSHHLVVAGERERAVPHLLAAADRAVGAGAPREAAAHYARALELGVPDDVIARVVERQAEAYHAFDMALCVKTAEEALALYRESGDRSGQSRMLRLAGRGHFYEGRPDQAERLTKQAIDVLDGEERPELARATAQQAGLLMARTAMAEALPMAERAIELARRTSDAWALANALITKGSALGGEQALPFLREGIDVAVRDGIVEGAIRGYNSLLVAMVPLGRPVAERRAVLDEALAYAQRHGVEQASLAYLRSQESAILFGTGEWDAALVAAETVHEASTVYRWSTVLRADIALAREGPDAALPITLELERAAGVAEVMIPELVELAAACARAGRVADARAYVERLEEVLARYPRGDGTLRTPRSFIGGPGLFSMLTVALLADAPELVERAEAEIQPGALRDRARASVAAARSVASGDADAAGEALARSIDGYTRSGLQAFAYDFTITCVRALRARAATLGPSWREPLAGTRAFAANVGARWWLSVLEDARP